SFIRSSSYRPLPSFPTRRSSDLGPACRRHLPGLTHRSTDPGGLVAARAHDRALRSARRPAESVRSSDRALRQPQSAQLRVLALRSEEHTSELQSLAYLVCRLLLE